VGAPEPEGDRELLDARVESAVDAARLAWPSVKAVAAPAFRARLAEALGERMASAELRDDRAAEVALALACCDGDPEALAALERSYLGPVRLGLSPMKLDPALADDVLQETRRKLLVGDNGPPRILEYAGQGRLRGLLQVVASRIAIDALRKQGRLAPLDRGGSLAASEVGEDVQGGSPDPALDYLRAAAGASFRAAFRRATESLTPRERNLLHMHHLRGVTLERLAIMYQVHRATIVRQLADIRRKLVTETERALKGSGAGDGTVLTSLLGLLGSQLDASMRGLLGEDGQDPTDPG
jgi:RNA polymerase sigma-70 factor (ECF subfamily)